MGDVAGTSRTFVELARNDGLDWVLRNVPAGRGRPFPRIAVDRAADLLDFLRHRDDLELVHINYGVSGYYGWGMHTPWVLHLHGTDVRQDLDSRWLGPVVRSSIERADRVLVATRDLLPAVTPLRPDAEWFPSPLPIGAFGPLDATERDSTAPPTVFYCSRWDPAKGADDLIESATALLASHPDWDVVGLDWGRDAARARQTGIRLLPLLSAVELRAQLDRADVVVGQVRLGELGLTDLEAMLRRRPVVAKYTSGGGDAEPLPIWNTTEAPIVEHIEAIIALGPDDSLVRSRTAAAREWVRDHHHPLTLFTRLKRTYAALGVRSIH